MAPSPKSTRFQFTAFEKQWPLFESMPTDIAEWGWQIEKCAKTQREHYQGYFRTARQLTETRARTLLPGVHIEVAVNWDALINYCRKKETAIEGTQVHQNNKREFWSMERAFCEIATYKSEYDEIMKRSDPAMNFCRNINKYHRGYYWYGVKQIVLKEPFRLSTFAQPQMEKTFIMTADIYSRSELRALVLQPEASDEA